MIDDDKKIIQNRILEFFGFSLVVVLISLAPLADLFIFKNTITEISLTEGLQEVWLAVIVGLFISVSRKHPDIRHGILVIAGFFSCLLIREMDFLTDQTFFSWFHLVLVVIGLCLYTTFKHKENVLRGIAHFCKSESYFIMLGGMLAVLVFSRLFGMKILWQYLLDDAYIRVAKNAAEEVTELFGYTLCLLAAVKYWRYTNLYIRQTDNVNGTKAGLLNH